VGLENLFLGFSIAITPFNLFVAVMGILLGTIIGVLPGLGGANGVAILLPLTFTMPPTSAIILLTSLYWGAPSAARSPPSCSTSRASRGRWPPPSTAIAGPGRPRARPSPPPSPPRSWARSSSIVLITLFRSTAGRDRAEVQGRRVLRHPAPDVFLVRRAGEQSAQVARLDPSSASSWPRWGSTSSPASCA
jgi:hypothetical protein